MSEQPQQTMYIERPQSPIMGALTAFIGAFLLVVAIVGIVHYWSMIVEASGLVVMVLIGTVLLGIPAGVILVGLAQYKKHQISIRHHELDLDMKQAQVSTIEDERRRLNEQHSVNMELALTRLYADERGNRPYLVDRYTGSVTAVDGGNYVAAPALSHYHLDYRPELPAPAAPGALLAAPDIHIPTFAESLASGAISPAQRDILFSYELVEDEISGQVTVAPLRGEIGSQHTQFIVAGSQSGKTTYMSGIVAQAIAMRTVLYIIDPHKNDPEKSIAAKLAPYMPWFILPPAGTHQEIAALLTHATKTRDDLIAGKSLFHGYHVMFLVDEVPALMQYQRSEDKATRALYLRLATFMQSIGTQTAKFGMTGLFASQFATKEALGEIDFRDACMSTLIMRLPPVQAQAMRILGKDRTNAIPKFPKGHGFLLLADSIGDPVRVASGNVTASDLTAFAGQLPPSPLPFATRQTSETSAKRPVSTGHYEIVETTTKQPNETALEASYGAFCQLKAEGFNQGQIIWKLFQARPGDNLPYQRAKRQYEKWDEEYRQELDRQGAWKQ